MEAFRRPGQALALQRVKLDVDDFVTVVLQAVDNRPDLLGILAFHAENLVDQFAEAVDHDQVDVAVRWLELRLNLAFIEVVPANPAAV